MSEFATHEVVISSARILILARSHSTIQRNDLAEKWGCLLLARITIPFAGSFRARCGTQAIRTAPGVRNHVPCAYALFSFVWVTRSQFHSHGEDVSISAGEIRVHLPQN